VPRWRPWVCVNLSAPAAVEPTKAPPQQTPEEFLTAVMNDPEVERRSRMDAAELLMRYSRGGGRAKKAALEADALTAQIGIPDLDAPAVLTRQ
jgi:hypothetical protein